MKLFRNNSIDYIYAPVNGQMVALSEVPDNIFASGMMGNGFAFTFDSEIVISPCYGEIVLIAKTKHAIGIKMENGAEILLHIGLDTVMLNGVGFESLVKMGQKVKPGTKLIKVDQETMRINKINMISMLIVTNTNEYKFEPIIKDSIKYKERLFIIEKNS